MGRKRTLNLDLPLRMVAKHGAYYHVSKVGREARWLHLGRSIDEARRRYRVIEGSDSGDPAKVEDHQCDQVIRPRCPPPPPTKWIYALTASDDPTVRYIGQTRRPYDRLQGHLKFPAPAIAGWIAELRARGAEPVMKLLLQVPRDRADEIELATIARFIACGAPILNRRIQTNRGKIAA